jgi:voltage-gated sodium channel
MRQVSGESPFDEDDDEVKPEEPKLPVRLVDSDWFNGIIMTGICVNALQMGLELEFMGDPWDTVWAILEHFFTAFFLVEMCIKLFPPLMGPSEYFSQRANLLDFCVVCTAVIDNWILKVVLSGEGSGMGFISILRLVRLARILKLLRGKRELMLLIEGIMSSMRSMVWLSLLLAILCYVTGIVMVLFIGKSDVYPKGEKFDPYDYFGTLTKSMFTALNLALMVDWAYVARPIMENQPHMLAFIGIFTGISCFGVMNAIIGVIVSRTGQAAKEAEAEDLQTFRQRQMMFVDSIKDIIYDIDTDGDGTVSPEEISQAQDNEELKEALAAVDLPSGFNMLELHCMLDKDGDGELTKAEFAQGMKRLIFCNDFHRQCLLALSVAQQKRKLFELREEMVSMMDDLTEKIDAVPKKVATLFQESGGMQMGGGGIQVSDKILSDGALGQGKKVTYDAQGNEITMPGNSPKEAWTASSGFGMNSQHGNQAMMGQGAALRSPSPTAQATAQALAEVSQALAVAAQNWDESCYSNMGGMMGGMGGGNLRHAGQSGGFRPQLQPGLVNQQMSQVPNNQFMQSPMQQRGRQGMMNPQGMMSPPGNAQGMMNPQGNAQGMNTQDNTQGMNPQGNAQGMMNPNQQSQLPNQQHMPNVPAHSPAAGQQHSAQQQQQGGNSAMQGGGRRTQNVNMSVV